MFVLNKISESDCRVSVHLRRSKKSLKSHFKLLHYLFRFVSVIYAMASPSFRNKRRYSWLGIYFHLVKGFEFIEEYNFRPGQTVINI